MRDEKRIDAFCDKLKEYWHRVPDWRFLQLIVNIFGDFENRMLWYADDDSASKAFDTFFNQEEG